MKRLRRLLACLCAAALVMAGVLLSQWRGVPDAPKSSRQTEA